MIQDYDLNTEIFKAVHTYIRDTRRCSFFQSHYTFILLCFNCSEVKDQFIKPNISLKGYVFYIIISVAMIIAFKLKDSSSLQMMCN
jgi:hypothetical protein